jgi:hypothetical protein
MQMKESVKRDVMLRVGLLLILLNLSIGCLRKSGGAPITPWERVTTDNALLAEGVNTVQRGTELAVTNGLLTVSQATPVMSFCGAIATAHLQITAVLEKGAATGATDYASLETLLQQIKDSGTKLVQPGGGLEIKNPKSSSSLAADIQSVVNLAQAILNALPQLQMNPKPGMVPVPPSPQPNPSNVPQISYDSIAPVYDLSTTGVFI